MKTIYYQSALQFLITTGKSETFVCIYAISFMYKDRLVGVFNVLLNNTKASFVTSTMCKITFAVHAHH